MGVLPPAKKAENNMTNIRSLLTIVLLFIFSVACIEDPPPPETVTERVVETVRVESTVDMQALLDAAVATVSAQTQSGTDLINIAEIPDPNLTPVPISAPSTLSPLALENQLTDLYDKVNPSTVFILVETAGGGGSGSGFVYDFAGHIVTNNHVVEGAINMEVAFADGQRRRARLIGTDVDSDLAVIRVDDLPTNAPPLPLSSMSEVDVGQIAVAIGNPFGEQGSMSMGIVSGLGRSLHSQRGSFQLPLVIQTDAPINPGNSGGPLLNLQGEVIGVNSAIRTDTGTNSGVGFSIPVDAVSIIAPNLIELGEHSYPFMGVAFTPIETIDRADAFGLDRTTGAYISQVYAETPAADAGLIGANNIAGRSGQGGDLVIALDGQSIRNFDDLNAYLVFNTNVGDTIQMTVLRDGQEMILPLTLGKRP